MLIIFLFIFLIFLCWGSFLNVVAHRSISDQPFLETRSKCPFCNKVIAIYDNIPVLSWCLLKGKCRNCKKPISILYPFIEILTAVVLTGVFFKTFFFYNFFIFSFISILSFVAYLIFFSALIIGIRTDLQALVIPQIFSLWLIPMGILFSLFDLIDISFYESIVGAILGYGVLWLTAKTFTHFTKKEGLGVGDMELLAMIGAFLGPIGVWFSLLAGSISGLIIAGIYLLITKKATSTKIPFGPFLALGAIIYFFFKEYLFFLLG